MLISKLRAFQPVKRHLKLVVVVGLCAVLLAVGAATPDANSSSGLMSDYEAARESLRKKYIKRLMPIDPESTEAMLANRGLDCLDPSTALS